MFLEEGRILVLDGAMGSMLQTAGPASGEFNPDALNLDAPWLIRQIHDLYISAGADIITTNSFGANAVAQEVHGRAAEAGTMARAAAAIARSAADAAPRKVLVAGSIGPTGKSLTLSGEGLDFDTLASAYEEQIALLRDGGADFILLETCFDALNAKAAIYALERLGNPLPLVVSVTVSDRSGRTLTGQTVEAFYRSISHAPTLSAFGMNCALGAAQMEPLITEVARFSSHPVIFYPNAGMDGAQDSPEQMASVVSRLASKGVLNICGGCCGTTPDHIRAMAAAVKGISPRPLPPTESSLILSGLEPIKVDSSRNLILIGERTNVAGSRKFARLISEGNFDEALQIAAAQVDGGASIIDVNMDDPMLDPTAAMCKFLSLAEADPDIARAAVMIDSSHWDTVAAALRHTPGKSIVNSISLKDGEAEFVRRAREASALGAAVVVMAFDENGQAVTFERKTEICGRSYRLLLEAGLRPQDIIFDPNVLTIGTGIPEHARFGVDFIEAVRWIKANLPGALTSGGISNLSFAFRGNNAVRGAMHAAFLYHASRAGLDMVIVNPQMLQVYDDIPSDLLKSVEDVIFDTDPDATARLVDVAACASGAESASPSAHVRKGQNRFGGDCSIADGAGGGNSPEESIVQAMVKGRKEGLDESVMACLERLGSAVKVIEGPLMAGMEKVGELFGAGKMFLPQVLKSASVMKAGVDMLRPYMTAQQEEGRGPKAVLATVQGDVHDIGKNIVATVLECSGFEVIDLGVMVPCEEILSRAQECGADIIGVSGLITPSLSRMEELCGEMAARGLRTPLFVGGAAASAVHTAVKLAPLYPNVHYGSDASDTAVKAKKCLLDADAFQAAEEAEHRRLQGLHSEARKSSEVSIGKGFCHDFICDESLVRTGRELLPYVDWRMFYSVCGLGGGEDEALKKEALTYVDGLEVRSAVRFFDCHREGCELCFDGHRLPFLGSIPDFFPPAGSSSPLGLFAASVGAVSPDAHVRKGQNRPGGDSSDAASPVSAAAPAPQVSLVEHALRVCLAEAASAALAERVSAQLSAGMKLIMPGIGYACCPDHSLKRDVLALLPESLGITLTETCAMLPEASVCGLGIAHADAAYLDVRHVDAAELSFYASLRAFSEKDRQLFLGHLSL